MLNYVREGDTIVVWKLDRRARSLIHLTKRIPRPINSLHIIPLSAMT
ncbi:recombinase family protein [Flagellimonas pacifica]